MLGHLVNPHRTTADCPNAFIASCSGLGSDEEMSMIGTLHTKYSEGHSRAMIKCELGLGVGLVNAMSSGWSVGCD